MNISHLNELDSIIDRLQLGYDRSQICTTNASDIQMREAIALLALRVEFTLTDLRRLVERITSDTSREVRRA